MRVRIFAFLVAALCAVPVAMVGCGDDPVVEDMATSDLSVTNNKTCLSIITCAAGCAGAAACVQACTVGASPTALQNYQALATCGLTQCIAGAPSDGGAAGDGGTKPCTSATDTSAACTGCAAAAAQSAACSTQLATCSAS